MKLSLHRQSNGYSKRRFFFASMGSSLALPAGDYEIWCVGAGADGRSVADSGGVASGGAGGIGIKRISTTTTHYIYISGGNVYFGPNNSSSGALASGLAASGLTGGSGTGDEAYTGGNGVAYSAGGAGCMGGNSARYQFGGVGIGGKATGDDTGTYAGTPCFSTVSGAFYPASAGSSSVFAQSPALPQFIWWDISDLVGLPASIPHSLQGNNICSHSSGAYPGCGGAGGDISAYDGGIFSGGGAFLTTGTGKPGGNGGPGGGGGAGGAGAGRGGKGGQAFAIIYSN